MNHCNHPGILLRRPTIMTTRALPVRWIIPECDVQRTTTPSQPTAVFYAAKSSTMIKVNHLQVLNLP